MITGIILASGFSRRMKEDKLLLEIHGEKIIERVIKACSESNLDSILLIYRTDEVKAIGTKYGIKVIYNNNAELGQSEGMKLGVREAKDSHSYMFFVGDQPFLESKLINDMIKEYEERKSSILLPYYNGSRGMPMIISSKYREELLNVTGDKGGREIVNNHMEEVTEFHILEEKLGMDIDTPEDLYKLHKGNPC